MYSIMTMTLGTFANNGKIKIGRLAAPAGLNLNRERLARDLVSLDDALAAGWEPFSVISDRAGTEVWLRRLVEEEPDLLRIRDPHVIHAMAHWHYSSGYRWTCNWQVSDKSWTFDLPSQAEDFDDWKTQEPEKVAKAVAAHIRLQLADGNEHKAPFKGYDIEVRLSRPGGGAFGIPQTFKHEAEPELEHVCGRDDPLDECPDCGLAAQKEVE